jgi:hypothetical protein
MMFRAICLFIKSRTGFGEPYIQEGHRAQSAPPRCALISEAGGGEVFPELPDEANVMIQIITRGNTYFQARDDAMVFYDALHGEAGWNVPAAPPSSGPDYLAMTIDATAYPQYIGQDTNGKFEFSVNFIFRMEEASCGVPAP